MKKTWSEKLEDKKILPKVLKLEEDFPCYNAMHKMGVSVGDPVVLVNASEIIPIMANIPKGRLITIQEICKKIARKHKVRGCCSLTTGIFIMTIANAVEEVITRGEKSALTKIPYWRTLKSDGFLNEKYPGGQEAQKKLLEKEGFKVVARGKKYQVSNCRDFIYTIS